MATDNPFSGPGGLGGGIRLPPISFLSGHSPGALQLNKLPSTSNLGISSLLSGSSSVSPQTQGHIVSGPPAKVSTIPTISHQHHQQQLQQQHQLQLQQQQQQQQHPLISQGKGYGLRTMSGSPPQLSHQHNFLGQQLSDEQIAKRLKRENDERIEATNSLQSLSNGDYHKQRLPELSPDKHQNPQIKLIPPVSFSPPKLEIRSESSLFINSNANSNSNSRLPPQDKVVQKLPQQINEEIEKELLDNSLQVDDTVILPTDNILPKDHNHHNKKTKVQYPPITLNLEEIKAIINEYYPICRYLGTIVYNPTTTWATLQILSLPGLKEEDFDKFIEIKQSYVDKLIENSNYHTKYIPLIPPLNCEYINYLIELKIPARFIEMFKYNLQNNETKRDLWGGAGGIYTDDSDILCVLAHLGLFSEDQLNMKLWNQSKVNIIKPLNTFNKPNDQIADLDLSIEIVLLPPLPQYYGFYANGINSRSWLGKNKHDGLSIAVHNIKWETCDTYLHDKQTFKRYQGELSQDKQLCKDQNNNKPGWSFHADYYKQLKKRFDKLETITN